MLTRTGIAAGYDPYFMAGYAKSLFSSPSSTMFEVAAFATGGVAPVVVYKVAVFLSIACLPLFVAIACALLGLGGITLMAASWPCSCSTSGPTARGPASPWATRRSA